MSPRPFTPISFQQFLNERKLMGSRCRKCQTLYLPPRPLCLKCQDGEMEWTEVKGKGKLVAFTVIAVVPAKMLAQGYGRDNPYCTGIVELEDGPKISARIIGADPKRGEVQIGMPLTIDFIETGEGERKKTTLAFKPA